MRCEEMKWFNDQWSMILLLSFQNDKMSIVPLIDQLKDQIYSWGINIQMSSGNCVQFLRLVIVVSFAEKKETIF